MNEYNPPFFLKSGHLQTVLTAFRKIERVGDCKKERINTVDGDFLDLNWCLSEKNKDESLVILSHGLEGCYSSPYIIGMSNAFHDSGWDILSWNLRGCSREVNLKKKLYNAGCTDDLDAVCEHALKTKKYKKVVLIGFSLGANLSLLYGSERRKTLSDVSSAIIAFSGPVDLKSSAEELAKLKIKIYEKRFIKCMRMKVHKKAKQFPEVYKTELLSEAKTIRDFDRLYVAPVHGFADEYEYWKTCSSSTRLDKIEVPTLIVNALDDPFLGDKCYPHEQAAKNKYIKLETPKYGGHVGFFDSDFFNLTWAEKRALSFANSYKDI